MKKPLSRDHAQKIQDGNRLNRAYKLRRELPYLTLEQALLCIAPECSDQKIEELTEVLFKLYLYSGPKKQVLSQILPESETPVRFGRLLTGQTRSGRRVIRKGTEMS